MPPQLKTEIQGEGTYDYKCDDPDCWYCDMMRVFVPKHRTITNKNSLTQDDIDYMAKYWNIKSLMTMSVHLNRSISNISQLAAKIGLPKKKVIVNRNQNQQSKRVTGGMVQKWW